MLNNQIFPLIDRKSELADKIQKQQILIQDLDLSDHEEEDFQVRVGLKSNCIPSPSLGVKLTQWQINELKTLLFPDRKMFNPEWYGKGFEFQTIPELKYCLVQKQGGPCGLLASLQAHIIKRIMISKSTNLHIFSDHECKRFLIEAMTDIIWQSSTSDVCFVALCFQPKTIDIIPELSLVKATCKENLERILSDNINQFVSVSDNCHGIILLLCSVIFSRGIDQIRQDMDSKNSFLMGKHGYCTMEMVNLMLLGYASSNGHDHNISFGGSVLKGISGPCEIGQLSLFEHYGHVEMGSFCKNPKFPIWVVCSESHYTVLFETAKNELCYYDGLAGQTNEIRLILSDGDATSESPLELVIKTKWKGVSIQWIGSDVLL